MTASPPSDRRARAAWKVLITALAAETIGGVLALVPFAASFFDAAGDEPGQRISVLLAGLFALAWVVITFVGSLRSRANWVRGSALTLHVLMFAAGTGSLQYGLLETWIGWLLVLLAFVGFFSALLARPEAGEPAAEASDEGETAA